MQEISERQLEFFFFLIFPIELKQKSRNVNTNKCNVITEEKYILKNFKKCKV